MNVRSVTRITLAAEARSADGRSRARARRRGPDDHAQPSRRSERVHARDAQGLPGGAQGSKRRRDPRGSRDRSGPRLLRRAWTSRSSARAPTTSPTASVAPTTRPSWRFAGSKARVRRGERRGGGRRAVAGVRAISASLRQATFVPAFINIGLIPDMGGTFFVTRLLGYARAFEWLTSAAQRSGGAPGVVSRSSSTTSWKRASPKPPPSSPRCRRAEWMTKRLLDGADARRVEEQLDLEAQLQAAAANRGLRRRRRGIPREARAALLRTLGALRI